MHESYASAATSNIATAYARGPAAGGRQSAGAASIKRHSRTLGHRGVLLLDELPEFSRAVLEALRQPLEDGVVAVARVGGHAVFPARFQLVGTINV